MHMKNDTMIGTMFGFPNGSATGPRVKEVRGPQGHVKMQRYHTDIPNNIKSGRNNFKTTKTRLQTI